MYIKYDPADVKAIVDEKLERKLKSHVYDKMLAETATQAMARRALIPELAVIWPMASFWDYKSVLEKLGILCSENEPCTEELDKEDAWDFIDEVASDLAGLFNNLASAYLGDAFSLYMGHDENVYGVTVFMYDRIDIDLWHHVKTLEEYWGYDFGPQGLCLIVDGTEWHIPADEKDEWLNDEEWIERFDAIIDDMWGLWENTEYSGADPYTLPISRDMALAFGPEGNTPQSVFQHTQYDPTFLEAEHETRISLGDLPSKARRDIIRCLTGLNKETNNEKD